MKLTEDYVALQLEKIGKEIHFLTINCVNTKLLPWLRDQYKYLKKIKHNNWYDSLEANQKWQTLSSFFRYRTEYVVRIFSINSLNSYRKFVQWHHVKIINIYQAACARDYGSKYSRQQKNNGVVSIIKADEACFLMTPLILSCPTFRSIVKVAIPIYETAGKVVFNFAQPKAIKVIYSIFVENVPREALSLLYGDDIQIITDARTYKRYLIMPIFPGVSLFDFYSDYVRPILKTDVNSLGLKLRQLFLIMRAIALDLQRIHAAKWVHHDLKPGNILLEQFSASGVKARIIDADDMRREKTPLVHELGTPDFSAPEVHKFVRGECANYSADIFSLGRTFICFLTAEVREIRFKEDKIENPQYSWEDNECHSFVYMEKEYSINLLEHWCDAYMNLPASQANRAQYFATLAQFKILLQHMLHAAANRRCNIGHVIKQLNGMLSILDFEKPQEYYATLPAMVALDDLRYAYEKRTGPLLAIDVVANPATPLIAKTGARKQNGCTIL